MLNSQVHKTQAQGNVQCEHKEERRQAVQQRRHASMHGLPVEALARLVGGKKETSGDEGRKEGRKEGRGHGWCSSGAALNKKRKVKNMI
jgi:hypothetical protein